MSHTLVTGYRISNEGRVMDVAEITARPTTVISATPTTLAAIKIRW